MHIVIFGASGKVGRLTVAEALRRGHSVRAVVHNDASGFSEELGLQLLQADVKNPEEVASAITGTDAVISTLGSWGTPTKDIVSTGVRHCISAMEATGIERIVTLTGTEARDTTDQRSLLRSCIHTLAKLGAGKILWDGEEQIRLLRASNLNWTALRSPVMTNSPRIFYALSLTPPKPWQTVPRRAIAKALIDQLDGPAYSKASPFIHPH